MIDIATISVIEGKKQILSDCTLSIQKGEKHCISGSSGSGKSTLLRVLTGLQPISSGSVTVCGIVLNSNTIWDIRRCIGYIPQNVRLYGASVRDELSIPFKFRAIREPEPTTQQCSDALDRVNLPVSLLDAATTTLSGGEQQRVAIAQMLLLNKEILCADEPTSALDGENGDSIKQLFDSLEITQLIVSHDTLWPPSYRHHRMTAGRLHTPQERAR